MSRQTQAIRHRTASTDISDVLIDAALQLLESDGLAGVTVRAVATQAAVAPMGVYSRFGNKDGLLEALFIHGFTQLERAITASPGADPVTRLLDGCMGYREFAVTHPQLYHLMFEQMMLLELSPHAIDTAKSTFAILVDRVHTVMHVGLIDAGDSVEVAQQIWSAMHGAVSLEIAGVHFAHDPQRNFQHLLDTLIQGLASVSRRRPTSPRLYPV